MVVSDPQSAPVFGHNASLPQTMPPMYTADPTYLINSTLADQNQMTRLLTVNKRSKFRESWKKFLHNHHCFFLSQIQFWPMQFTIMM